MSYLEIARRVIEEGGIEKTPHALIDQTIREINKEWKPGTLTWMKANRPEGWGKVLALEGEIDEMALGSDLSGLREALSEYQGLIISMVREFKVVKEKKGQGMFKFVESPSPPDGLEVRKQ